MPSTDAEDVLSKKPTPIKPTSSTVKIHADVGVTSSGDEGSGLSEGIKREGCVYNEARTYVYLELQLDRPFIPKRSASVLATRYAHVGGWVHGGVVLWSHL